MLCGMLEMNTAARKLRLIGKPVPTLDPENDRFGHPVDDRADDDAHRTAHSRLAEAALHHPVGGEEDGHADQHPQGELPAIQHVFRLHDEVGGDRCNQRSASEAGHDPDEAGWNIDPAGEEAGEEQGRRPEQPEAEGLKHASPSAPPQPRPPR
jgi:hypothetical protein